MYINPIKMKYEPTLSLLQRGTVIVPPRETIAPLSEKQRGAVIAPRREIIAPLSPLQLKTMNARTVVGGRAATVGSLGGGDLNGTAAQILAGAAGCGVNPKLGGGPPYVPPPVVTSVWSAADAAALGFTLTNGGLTATSTRNGVWNTLRGTVSKTSGKLYIEFLCVVCSQGDCNIGLGSTGMDISSYFGHSNYGGGQTYNNVTTSVGVSNGWTSGGTGPATYPVPGDVWAIAIDFTTGNTWVSKNNTWSQGNPATGTSPILVFTLATTGALFPGMGFLEGGDRWTLQPTAASQGYAPPAGFTPWG